MRGLLSLLLLINANFGVNNGVTAETTPPTTTAGTTDDEKCAMLQRCVDSFGDETKCSFIIQINSDQCNLTSSNQTQVCYNNRSL